MMRTVAGIGALLFLLALLTDAPACARVYISGRVLVNGTGAPAPGVTLALFMPGSADTDDPVDVAVTLPNGAFVLKAPGAGPFRVTGSGAAYDGLDQAIQVPKVGLPSLDFHIAHKPSMRLRLLAPDGRPVHGGDAQAWITLPQLQFQAQYGRRFRGTNRGWRAQRGFGLTVDGPVGRDGVVEILLPDGMPNPPGSGVVVGARLAGTGCGQVTLDRWPNDPVTVPLARGLALQGFVRDEAGKAVPGAHVIVLPDSWYGSGRFRQARLTADTDAQGQFRIGTLLPGDYMVISGSPDGARCTALVSLAGPVTTVTLSPAERP